MSELKSLISRTEKQGIMLYAIFAVIFFVVSVGLARGIIVGLFDSTLQLTRLEKIIPLLLLFVVLPITLIAGMKATKRIRGTLDPLKSDVWWRFVKLGDSYEFLENIDYELRSASTASYMQNQPQLLGFWLTSKWIILISARGSVIRRRTDLSLAYARTPLFSTGARYGGTEYIYLKFVDGLTMSTRCGIDGHSKILSIIKAEMPHVIKKETGK